MGLEKLRFNQGGWVKQEGCRFQWNLRSILQQHWSREKGENEASKQDYDMVERA